jgi:hypothetical protein
MGRLFAFFFFLGLAGCATIPQQPMQQPISQPVQQIEKYEAKFDYTTLGETAAPRSAEVTFTILNALFKTKGSLAWFASQQFVNLPDTIKQDLQKILIAKGLSVLGPYTSYDLIPFQDKKDIDLLLIPTIELSAKLKDQNEQLENYWAWQSPTIQTGNAEISGNINIEMREIVTRELMWVKSIPFKEFEFPYLVRIPWGKGHIPGKLYNYDPIIDGMAKGVEQQYPQMMATIYKLIDSEEMKIIKKQAHELKVKKGY